MSLLFSLRHPWPICLPWAFSAFLLTLYSHGLLLTSLDFPSPITSYSSLGFMGLPSIPYFLCLHCFRLAATHSYFFHIIHCPWVCYSLFLSFWVLLRPFAFSRPNLLISWTCYLLFLPLGFNGFCSLSFADFFSICVAMLGFLPFIWVSQKKRLLTFSPLNIWSVLAVHMWIKDLLVPSTSLFSFPSRAFLNYEPRLIYIYISFPVVNSNDSLNFPKRQLF